MQLGIIKVFKEYQKISFVVEYQTPIKPTFFEYLILNIITTYPLRDYTIAQVLKEEFNLNDLKIYEETIKYLIQTVKCMVFKDLVESMTMHSYADDKYLDKPIRSYALSLNAKKAFSQKLLVSNKENKYYNVEFIIDQWKNELFIYNSKEHNLKSQIPNNAIVIKNKVKKHFNHNDLKDRLDEYKKNISANNPFTIQTTFSNIIAQNKNVKQIEKLSELSLPVYEQKEINIALTKYKDVILQVKDDRHLQDYLENNEKVQNTIMNDLINNLQQNNKAIFKTDIKKINTTLFEQQCYDPWEIDLPLNNHIVLVNADKIDEMNFLNKKCYADKANIFVFFNSSKNNDVVNFHLNKPIIYINKSNLYIDTESFIIFLNNNDKIAYALQNLAIPKLNQNIALAFMYKAGYSKELIEILIKKINANIENNIKVSLTNKDFKNDIINVYLLELLWFKNNLFYQWAESILSKVKDNLVIYNIIKDNLNSLRLAFKYEVDLHKIITKQYQKVIKNETDIIKTYSFLISTNIFKDKEILSLLEKTYTENSVNLEQILHLEQQFEIEVYKKIWNLNLFNCVTSFLKAISSNNVIKNIATDSKHKSGIFANLIHFYQLNQDNLKAFINNDLFASQKTFVQLFKLEQTLIEQLSNINNSEQNIDLIYQIANSLQQTWLSKRYQISQVINEKFYQTMIEQHNYSEASIYLIHLLDQKVNVLLTKVNNSLSIEQKLYQLRWDKKLDKKQFNTFLDLSYQIKAIIFLEKLNPQEVGYNEVSKIKSIIQEVQPIYEYECWNNNV